MEQLSSVQSEILKEHTKPFIIYFNCVYVVYNKWAEVTYLYTVMDHKIVQLQKKCNGKYIDVQDPCLFYADETSEIPNPRDQSVP